MSSLLETYFHGSDTQFGIFYPTNYIVAIFPGLEEAIQAQRALLAFSLSEEDVLAVPAEDVVQYAEEHLQKSGLWSRLAAEVSRLIGTEAVYADQDLAMAHQGHSFLAVHTPTETRKQAVWEIIEPFAPITARYYARTGIEVFRGAGADHKPEKLTGQEPLTKNL